MRTAETVLGVIHERGKKGLPLEKLYRQLYNPNLYLLAYGRIYRNAGALTPGSTKETVDGMSLAKIGTIIDAVRHEKYRWTPARRVYINKKNSKKKRPLGIPTWSDKLLQEVMRLILEALKLFRVQRRRERQDFERHLAAQRDLLGFVNHAHAAAADFAEDAEVAEDAGLKVGRPRE